MSNDIQWPQVGDVYWIIRDEWPLVEFRIWGDTPTDKHRKSIGNCFPTAVHANRRIEALKVAAELRAMPGVFIPGDGDAYWGIECSLNGTFFPNIAWSNSLAHFMLAGVCFRTDSDCRHAINTIGQERLALYRADFLNLPIRSE